MEQFIERIEKDNVNIRNNRRKISITYKRIIENQKIEETILKGIPKFIYDLNGNKCKHVFDCFGQRWSLEDAIRHGLLYIK